MMKDFLSDFMKDEKVKKEVENSLEQTAIISPYHRMSINADRKVSGISKPTVVMTSGNLVNLNAFEKVGGFKEWLYIDGVDFDFCMECRKKGFEIIRLNQVELKHDLGNITVHKFFKRKVYTDNHSAIRRYYIIRNRHYLFDMHSDAFLPSCKGELSQTKYEVLRIILYEKDKIRKLKYMFKGYRDYKKGKKGPLCI